jgi:(p)ppGpp synthase/HD superfamily hydrolase
MAKLTDRFEKALLFAARRHAKQKRKGTEVPYVSHLLAVCALVIEQGGTEDEAIAALLHDAIEDRAATLDEIRDRFGDKVAGIVIGCSDTDEYPKPPWKARKTAYIEHVKSAGPSERLVSAADKLHNAQSILRDYRLEGERVWDRFNADKQQTLWYYRELVKALRLHGSNPLVDQLDSVLKEIRRVSKPHRRQSRSPRVTTARKGGRARSSNGGV